jgi:serine/threonine protein kinase
MSSRDDDTLGALGDEFDDLWDAAMTEAFANAETVGPDPSEIERKIGRYLLLGEIARGGVGVVLRGRDEVVHRDVAIKTLRRDHRHDAAFVERFLEEAQITGQLHHPGICPIHEIGVDSSNRPFFVMELIEGKTLAAELAARKDPSEDRARFVGVFERVADTMAFAHSRGVIHRDLKPANVMIGAFGEVRVVDWGFAKVLDTAPVTTSSGKIAMSKSPAIRTLRTDSDSSNSMSGEVLGTPTYMAPEQARGEIETLDERADVFALGAILCEILTGEPPFLKGDRRVALTLSAAGNLEGARERLAACGADEELRGIAIACLASRIDDRPRTAEDVAKRIRSYIEKVGDRARAAEVAAAEARVRVAAERRARNLTALLAVAVVLFFVIAGWLVLSRSREKMRERTQRESRLLSLSAEFERHFAAGDLAAAGTALSRANTLLESAPEQTSGRRSISNLETRLAAARAEIETRRVREAREMDLVDRLDEISSMFESLPEDVDAAYRDAFVAAGIDLEKTAPEMAATRILLLREGSVARVVTALDDWSVRRRDSKRETMSPDDSREPRRPLPPRDRLPRGRGAEDRRPDSAAVSNDDDPVYRVLQLVDPDPWRCELRVAAAADDMARVQELSKTVQLATQSPRSIELLCLSLARAGQESKACEILREAVDHQADAFWLHHHLSMLLDRVPGPDPRSTGEPKNGAEALLHSEIAVAIEPRIFLARDRLAELLRREGRMAEAVRVLEAGLRISPESERVREVLVRTHLLTGRVKEAVAVAAKAGETASKAILRRAVGRAARTGTTNERRALVESWRAIDPELPGLDDALLRIALIVGDLPTMDEAAQRIIARGDPSDEAVVLGAAAKLLLGRYDEARESIKASHLRDRPIARGMLMMAHDLARVVADPKVVGPGIRTARARVLLHQRKIDEAGDLLAVSVDRSPSWLEDYEHPPLFRPQEALPMWWGDLEARDLVAVSIAWGTDPKNIAADPKKAAAMRRAGLRVLRARLGPEREATRGLPRRPAPDEAEAWFADRRLGGVRDEASLAQLPKEESDEWRAEWQDLVRRRVR